MKRIIALILCLALMLSACTTKSPTETPTTTSPEPTRTSDTSLTLITPSESPDITKDPAEVPNPTSNPVSEMNFTGLNDENLLRYVEDTVYSEVVTLLASEMYFVENVSAVYISKEYLDELEYNSQANIYFGYTLSELYDAFEGIKFVFTLGDDGQTTVKEFEAYDDTYDKVIRNVAIGTGVILLCVTVSVVTAGIAPAAAVSVIFAASAKSASIFALSGGLFSGVATGIITGIQTKDFDKSLKAAALSGSEGFMWGAMTGAVTGGVQSAIALKGATINGLTMNEAAAIQRESGLPLDVIKTLQSREQYEILKNANVYTELINNKTMLIRTIDLDFADELGRTNLQRMEQGLAALDPSGLSYELHHIGQNVDSTLAILTKAEHMQGGNNLIWHDPGLTTTVHAAGNNWDATRQATWKSIAQVLGGV